jgi:cell division protease FtsH
VLGVIKSCHQKALDIIRSNREALDKISDYLISKETITGEEFMKILNEVDGVEVKEDIKEEVKEDIVKEDIKEETIEDKGELN